MQAVRHVPPGQMLTDSIFTPDQNEIALLIGYQKPQCGRYYDARTMVTAHRIERNRD